LRTESSLNKKTTMKAERKQEMKRLERMATFEAEHRAQLL
jgi:hypothetical protein